MPSPGPTPQISRIQNDKRRTLCWQGWQVAIPRRWDPVKLEGDHAEGYALFADALRPRLGLRWQTPKKVAADRDVPKIIKAVKLALRQEVGQLAADEAVAFDSIDRDLWPAAMLYIEPEPPGRDVFSGFSHTSGRLLQIAYHAHRRERILAGSILPTLIDLPSDRAMPWSIFDLSCVIPGGMRLKSQRLNVGDLGLTFADRYHELTLRQIAVATLALQRQNLDGWIADQQKTHKRYHRPTGVFTDAALTMMHREQSARRSSVTRRRRFFLMRSQPREFTTMAVHDADRDRIVILEGTDESLLQVVATTVGRVQDAFSPAPV